ncbi:MAG: hypothetical protein IT384_22435 [Deltaproteobacteria bacterium]|nr:hypothetical protein [Deltaproteobacteria bacterium]
MRLCGGALAVLAVGGCFPDLPPEYRVDDLRVLDLRVRPPELGLFARTDDPLAFDPNRLPPVVSSSVVVTALVAHPDLDATFRYDWVRCAPGLGRIPCEGGTAERLDPNPGPVLVVRPIDLLLSDLASGGSLQQIGATLAADPRDLLDGLYTFVNLSAHVDTAALPVDTTTLDATKRVVIFEPRLVAFTIREARQLVAGGQLPAIEGLPTLCTEVTPAQQRAIDAYLSARQPNQPPSYRQVEAALAFGGRVSTSTFSIGNGDTITVAPDEELLLRAVTTATDAEAYRLIDANCNLQDFDERLVASWFTQLGTLSRQLTTDENPSTRYTAPAAVELGSQRRARIWSVLRDGRGGSDHLWFDVLVDPSAAPR